jgi:cysteine desulfurase
MGAMIYLDNHSSTKPCAAALQQWQMGQDSAVQSRSSMIYELAGASEKDRFIFTSDGAEGVTQVFWSLFLEKARKEGKTHFIVSAFEDLPTMQMAKRLEELGCTIKIAPIDENGKINVDALKELISPRTALISVTMAHGLTGVIQPVDEIVQIAKEKNVLLHLDANYAIGKYPMQFESDYLTFSGDRIHSVKGSGGLFAKPNAPLVPLIFGKSFDAPSFMALSAAAQQAAFYLDSMALEVVRLRDLLEELVGGKPLYKDLLRLPNTTAIVFENVHQEALLYFLNRKGVYASMGGSYAQRLPEQALSFSLSRMTTEEEIRKAALIINEAVSHLQMIAGSI